MKIFWKIAFRNLFRNGRRNLFTGSSIALGLVGVSLLGGYILRMERYLATQSVYLSFNGHVIVYAPQGLEKHLALPKNYSINPELRQALLSFAVSDSRVARTNQSLQATGLVHNGCVSFPYYLTAVQPEIAAWAMTHPQVLLYVQELSRIPHGKGFWESPAGMKAVNVSERLAASLKKAKFWGDAGTLDLSKLVLDCTQSADREKLKLDPSLQMMGMGFEGGLALGDVTLTGVYNTGMAFTDDTALMMGLADAQAIYNTDKITSFSFFLKNENDIRPFLKDLNKFLQSKQLAADIYPFYDEKISAFYVGGMAFNWVMLGFFLVLVCGVVVISISNSIYIALMERKAELGTLRSIGFCRADCRRLLVFETALLVAISLVAGLLLTGGIMFFVNSANLRFQVPGLAGDLQFVLHLTTGFLIFVVLLLFLLANGVSALATRQYLKREILDLLGASSC